MPQKLPDDLRELIDYLLSLRSDRIRELLRRLDLPRSGPKRELRRRLNEAARDEDVTAADIAAYLDEVEPWGNQHVYLYDVADEVTAAWRNQAKIRERLKQAGLGDILDEPPQLIIPPELTLATIVVATDSVEIRAVESRGYTERVPDYDQEGEIDGTPVEYHAYTRRTGRGLFTLRWDLANSQAALHISKAHRGYDYELAEGRFGELIQDWLGFKGSFTRLDLRKAIQTLAQKERDGNSALTRSIRVGMQSAGGREIDVSSADAHTAAAGEKAVDEAVNSLAKVSRGRLGNVFWLDQARISDGGNPLEDELHTVILAADSRIHFMAPSDRPSVEYVLRNVRRFC